MTIDAIDWTHVAPEYKWMARDYDGDVYLFEAMPIITDDWLFWTRKDGGISLGDTKANAFASYRRGTCDWRDSLVHRPEGL